MSLAKKSNHVDPRSGDTFRKPSLYANRIAPPLKNAPTILKPSKASQSQKPTDRKVKLLGAIGDSDWSRSHRVKNVRDSMA